MLLSQKGGSVTATSLTTGEFTTEELALNAFDEFMNLVPLAFRNYKEVEGIYIHPRVSTEDKTARIDRLLIPIAGAVEAGWIYGAIGVEAKKSETKAGPLVTQALDYTRCAFELPTPKGVLVVPKWIFIYPLEVQGNEIASVMANNRIGSAWVSRDELVFASNHTQGLRITRQGKIFTKPLPMVNKRGSR